MTLFLSPEEAVRSRVDLVIFGNIEYERTDPLKGRDCHKNRTFLTPSQSNYWIDLKYNEY